MTYVIAEIGQNHQGSRVLAEEMVRMCANPRPHDFGPSGVFQRVGAVKFTVRDMDTELTRKAADAQYRSKHAFGDTYQTHREALELSWPDLRHLRHVAAECKVDFGLTVCSADLVQAAEGLRPDFFKVASRDLNNVPLLRELAGSNVPVILSTGMYGQTELDRAVGILHQKREVGGLTILHCRSVYPCPDDVANLSTLKALRTCYPGVRIGYSDHTEGMAVALAAVALGAEVLEKHVTLDRTMRGSDHAGSLERDGLWRLLRDVYRVRNAVPGEQIGAVADALPAMRKLGRVVTYRRSMHTGDILTPDDLTMSSAAAEEQGVPNWYEVEAALAGSPRLRIGVQKGDPFQFADVALESRAGAVNTP